MVTVANGIYYTGVLNPNMRVFDVIMRTEYGTSYNSYLVKGSEKVAAVEAAHAGFFDYYLKNLQEALGDTSLDYLVLNHCEPDHTGCIARLLEVYPELTIVVSQAGSLYIRQITNCPDIRVQVVKDGDMIDLGGKTLKFLNAPFLHWPDSMFTWAEEDKVLFSCDFLGAHYCEPQIYDTRVAYPESYLSAIKYYYDCIFGPFKPYVRKGLEKIDGLDIDFVCNSHGPILTKTGRMKEVMESYRRWSAPQPRAQKQIPIFYVSAYGNTGKLAGAILQGIRRVIPDAEVQVYNLIEHDMAEMQAQMNESDAFLLGSPTINRDAVAPVWQLLAGVEAVGIQKRPVAVFGSFGWSGEGAPNLAQRLTSLKANIFEKQLRVTFVPTQADLDAAADFGEEFAKTL